MPPRDVVDAMQERLANYREFMPPSETRRAMLADFDFARDAMELLVYLRGVKAAGAGTEAHDDGIRLCEDYLRKHARQIVEMLERSAARARQLETERWMREAEGKGRG
jgi:hypothetical protein